MAQKIINNFSGKYEFLSNFYPSEFYLEGHTWKTVEHYFQAQKCLRIDNEMFKKIKDAKRPIDAKRLGRKCKLVDGWEIKKNIVMNKAINEKFAFGSKLCSMLLDTKDAKLIEGNHHHDNCWGDCSCSKCKNINGLNKLGRELMLLRKIRNLQNKSVE